MSLITCVNVSKDIYNWARTYRANFPWQKKNIWNNKLKLLEECKWTRCTGALNHFMSSHAFCPHQLSMKWASKTPQWPPKESLLVVILGNVQRTNAVQIWVRNRHCAKLCSACARLGVQWKSVITTRSIINQGNCTNGAKVFRTSPFSVLTCIVVAKCYVRMSKQNYVIFLQKFKI